MAESERQIQGVIVQIMGDEYQISSQSDPADVQRIAAHVDRKMREIAGQHAGRVPKASLAVLAAMEITGELFGAMQEQSRLTETAQENLDRLTHLIDERATLFSSLMERGPLPLRRLNQEQPVTRGRSAPVE